MKTKGNTIVLEFCIRVVVKVMFIVFNTTSFEWDYLKTTKYVRDRVFFTRLYLIVGVLDTTLCDKVCQ